MAKEGKRTLDKSLGGLSQTGLAEEAAAAFVGQSFSDDAERRPDPFGSKLKVGPGGRVLIPAELRAALGVAEGDTLVATLEDGELRLMSVQTAVLRAQALVRRSIPVLTGSVVDELIADRRRENERDSA